MKAITIRLKKNGLHLAACAAAIVFIADRAVAQTGQLTDDRHRAKISSARSTVPSRFGAPLLGLSADQTVSFQNGLDEFENAETVDSGLGPTYNNVSCGACHSLGGTGGAGTTKVTRYARLRNGAYDPMAEFGGPILHAFATDPRAKELLPPEATIVAHRITTPLFGAGLIEAIDDETIRLNAARPQPDGVHGVVSIVDDVSTGKTRIGRFGWKAQHATLLSFAGDAYRNEMGITNRLFPTEHAPNGDLALLKILNPHPHIEDESDPATHKSDIDRAADFIRFLAPPAATPMSESALAGAKVFSQIRCTSCHMSEMFTSPSAVSPLGNQRVALYSDLLLHDMGALGDGIQQGNAGQQAMRTAPLWGLGVRQHYLHDGRTTSLDKAIDAHDGEARAARDRWEALSHAERRQLLEFLKAL